MYIDSVLGRITGSFGYGSMCFQLLWLCVVQVYMHGGDGCGSQVTRRVLLNQSAHLEVLLHVTSKYSRPVEAQVLPVVYS